MEPLSAIAQLLAYIRGLIASAAPNASVSLPLADSACVGVVRGGCLPGGLNASKFVFPWVKEDEVASHVFDICLRLG